MSSLIFLPARLTAIRCCSLLIVYLLLFGVSPADAQINYQSEGENKADRDKYQLQKRPSGNSKYSTRVPAATGDPTKVFPLFDRKNNKKTKPVPVLSELPPGQIKILSSGVSRTQSGMLVIDVSMQVPGGRDVDFVAVGGLTRQGTRFVSQKRSSQVHKSYEWKRVHGKSNDRILLSFSVPWSESAPVDSQYMVKLYDPDEFNRKLIPVD